MNKETEKKYHFIVKSMRSYQEIKQIWMHGDRLKILVGRYGVELFCDVWCSLKHEDVNCIIGRLKRMLNELKVQYNQQELEYDSIALEKFLNERLSSFSLNDYNNSACDAL